MKVEMIRSEICELLGVKNDALKKIIRLGQLEQRIIESGTGFKYVGEHKEGRSTIYELESVQEDEWKQLQNYYGITKKEEHTTYTITRLENLDKTRSRVIKMSRTGIDNKTAKKFDEILVNENIMAVDKMVYVKQNVETKEFIEITEEEYKMFWKDKQVVQNALADVHRRNARGEISNSMMDYSIAHHIELAGQDGFVCYKFQSYKELEMAKGLAQQLKDYKEGKKSFIKLR